MKRSRKNNPRHTVHARYLPGYVEGGAWGIAVFNTGDDFTPAGFEEYPYLKDKDMHPDHYFFTWEKGRVLDDYQILINMAGRGVIESKTGGCRPIRQGDAFILFPGEWHRYRPNKATGWHVWWIGLRGTHALHLMNTFFSPRHPVIPLENPKKVLEAYREISKLVNTDPERFAGRIAALATAIIDEVQSANQTLRTTALQDLMNKAKLTLLARSQEEVDLAELSADLGMSYSKFRRAFQQSTGLPPRQYLLAIRINRAKALLAETDRRIADIASAVGFSNQGYFARYFQQAAGLTPLAYRKKMRK
ncbi:MAG: AraC family transcriptional regulator [Kiritimatiellales bacterium]|jgi:AraC-like DNA-binding protein